VSVRDTSIEARIGDVLRRVTGQRDLGPHSHLGLDSLEAAEMVFALEEEFGVRLSEGRPPETKAAAARAVARARGEPEAYPPLDRGFGHLQWLARAALGGILGRYFRVRVEGVERVPPAGPVVLASNHDSLLDIPFLAVASPRPVWFMAKEELFGGPLAAWFFHAIGGFPVDRVGPDAEAMRAARQVLREGRVLGMYPEGTRSRDLLPLLPGAAWAALAEGAALVPVRIQGTAEAMPRGSAVPRRTRVRVAFGEPFDLGREDQPRARVARAREVTRDLRDAVEKLA
jgi:1-acyl-sn-glycerol-3-phosphate acyltransferase